MSSQRVGVFGGTFDPPHLAHLEIAKQVQQADLVDIVLMVPCFRHVFDKHPVSFDHRLEMCRLLTGQYDFIEVSDIESRISTPGRSLALIEALEAENPDWSFRLVLGADIYLEKDKWHRFDLIEQKAPPIYFGRKGVAMWKDDWLPAPQEVSSSELREYLLGNESETESVEGLIGPTVLQYIKEHQLYGV